MSELSFENIQRRNNLYGFEFIEPDKRRKEHRKSYEIKQLWQRSHEILNLAARGFKNVDIARILNITPKCVTETLNSRLGQLKLSDLRQSRDEETRRVQEKIRVLTDKALETYHQIFEDESGEATLKDRKSVADTVLLELSGLRVPTKVQSHSVHTTLSKEELEEFKKRGIQAAREAGLAISEQGPGEEGESISETNRDED